VVAAVSGGPDSLALLVLATQAGLAVTAVHVDHGLRPGSDTEAGVVADAASRLSARFLACRVAVAPGPDLEARARAARYAVLPVGVMTGHTADDRAETLLLNLLRGAGLDGLAPMRGEGAGPAGVSRPLLALRRADTEAVCAWAGLQPVRDPSNDDLRFRRNAVRRQVMPLLAEVAGRDPVPILCRQADLLGEDAAWLAAQAAGIDPTDAAALTAAPPVLARRAVRRWLREGADEEHHPPSAAEVARVLTVARGDAVGCELAGGRRIRRHHGRLTIEPPAPGGATGRR
jgi:tRNA(Ile)-lysidine synthase